jgi:hypothetical protein
MRASGFPAMGSSDKGSIWVQIRSSVPKSTSSHPDLVLAYRTGASCTGRNPGCVMKGAPRMVYLRAIGEPDSR